MRTRSAIWAALLVFGLVLLVSGITGTFPDILGDLLAPGQMEVQGVAHFAAGTLQPPAQPPAA